MIFLSDLDNIEVAYLKTLTKEHIMQFYRVGKCIINDPNMFSHTETDAVSCSIIITRFACPEENVHACSKIKMLGFRLWFSGNDIFIKHTSFHDG